MKKLNKICLILIITFLLVNIFNQVFAAIDTNTYKPTDPTTDDAVKVVEKVGVILGAIRNISVVISVIFLMIIGFKYMIGSVEEKANYKATMGPLIIGFILVIAGTTIVSFIYNAIH